MISRIIIGATVSVLLSSLMGCASGSNTRNIPAAPGVPQRNISDQTLNAIDPPDGARRTRTAQIAPPDLIALPASYRYMIVDGKTVLVRETDAQMIRSGPASLRVVAGEVARGEIAYQPALLPQEIATELVRVRQAQAGADEANIALRSQADELMKQAAIMQQQNAILVQRLGQVAAYARELEQRAGVAAAPAPAAQVKPEDSK